MESLVGVLVDVSHSMKTCFSDSGNRRGGEWARANFDLVDNLVKHDLSHRNHVFSLCFGGRAYPSAFDLLNTIGKERPPDGLTLEDTIERVLEILEKSGAPRVRRWAKMSVLLSVIEEHDAKSFLDIMTDDSIFSRRFANECLPKECRGVCASLNEVAGAGLGAVSSFYGALGSLTGSNALKRVSEDCDSFATADSIREVIVKGKQLLKEHKPKYNGVSIGEDAVMDAHKARTILHGRIKKDDLTNERVDALMDDIRPYIYGATPLMKTLQHAKCLFSIRKFNEYNKLLFILSDGKATDDEISPPIEELNALGVKTVSCYITAKSICEPKRLYSQVSPSWDSAAKFMFKMSSKVKTELIPRTIFVKRGWKIDIENNETRLFVQVNHPDLLDDVCDLARDIVCSQDALSDLLSSIDLDLYINQANQGFEPQEQEGGTCYANASAAVLHLAMKRIIGRDGGVPDFFTLRDEIIGAYGEHGANTVKVLQEVCPKYRLHCREVEFLGALKAITEKRPVVARFRLTDAEWDRFSNFYRRNPRGILSLSDLRVREQARERRIGHAVVLTSFDSQCLRLMNSWSDRWADGGFFRVSDANVLDLEFVDVFWTIADLKQSEKNAYSRHGADVAQNLFARLRGLQMAQYKCPLCHNQSKLGEFTGHALETRCPICKGSFRIENPGEDLALNLYLVSLSTPQAKQH